jgi:creatinine amidohydrolase/Fe(II)-dependent formamide hydrolase-like protein
MPRLLVSSLALLALAATARAQVYQVRELNTEQLRALDREKTVVIVPGGILEEHGPYLPAYSDGYMNERLAQQLADAVIARPGWQTLVFPVIPLGHGGANIIGRKYSFPGSYTVRMATLRALFMDLADELGEQGFRWIFIVHVHGAPEHNRALDQASAYFRETYGGQMVHLAGFMSVFGALGVEQSAEEAAEDGFSVHAGTGEHSVNLFLRPDRVSPAHKEARPHTGRNFADLVRIARAEGWPGYFGSPRLASAAHGARVWNSFSEAAVAMALRILEGYDHTKEPRYVDVISADPEVAAVNQDALAHDRRRAQKQQAWLATKGFE